MGIKREIKASHESYMHIFGLKKCYVDLFHVKSIDRPVTRRDRRWASPFWNIILPVPLEKC